MLKNSRYDRAGGDVEIWHSRLRRLNILISLIGVTIVLGITFFIRFGYLDASHGKFATAALVGIMIFGVILSIAFAGDFDHQVRQRNIQVVERARLDHPEKPQLAWDLARIKLEDYLDRNLSQVRAIFWLTLFVMTCGFIVVMYGLFQASQSPETLPMSIVAAGSGILISFIGGSFLLIYKSILAQSRGYVSVLERINAVGMAIQVIANIPDSSAELKHTATAELARQLLGLYANTAASATVLNESHE